MTKGHGNLSYTHAKHAEGFAPLSTALVFIVLYVFIYSTDRKCKYYTMVVWPFASMLSQLLMVLMFNEVLIYYVYFFKCSWPSLYLHSSEISLNSVSRYVCDVTIVNTMLIVHFSSFSVHF